MGATGAFATLGALCLCLYLIAVGFVRLASGLRRRIPARVNCWFCNTNSWVTYRLKNSWCCKKCDQYNGFLQNGDYNVVLDTRTVNATNYNKNIKHLLSANNGLCRKCNINQQLKIRQLSSFVPMNERNFDAEVDIFKAHLEKVYSLCSICKKYLKHKLSAEKGLILGTKLLDNRTKHEPEIKTQVYLIRDLLHVTLKIITLTFLITVLYNVFINLDLFLSKKVVYVTKKYFKDLSTETNNIFNFYADTIFNFFMHYLKDSSFTSAYSFVASQYLLFVTSVESYSNQTSIPELQNLVNNVENMNLIDAITIAGFTLQLFSHVYDFNMSSKNFINDVVWGATIYISRTGIKYLYVLQILLAIILLINLSHKNRKQKTSKSHKNKLKNLSSNKTSNDDIFDDDSDSDSSISVCSTQNYFKAGLKSSPGSVHSLNCGKENTFSPFLSQSQYKSLFNLNNTKFSNFSELNNKSESELDESISSLSIGRQNKISNTDPFRTRQYNCTSPSIFMPLSGQFSKPILSPSRLAHGTQQSWVAGGYWGSDSSQCNLHETGSSSSQSSGFESLASSMHHRNLNSFPPSREESVSSECDRRNNENLRKIIFNNTSGGTLGSFVPQTSPVQSAKPNESVFVPSAPFDCNYRMYSSAFAKPSSERSFVPLSGPFSNIMTHRFPT